MADLKRKDSEQLTLTPRVRQFLTAAPVRMLIGGEWCTARSGRTFSVYDPSSGEVLAQVAEGGAEEIDAAVAAARAALPRWKSLMPAERAARLWKLSELIERDADDLAIIDTFNVGLPISRTRNGEIPAAVEDLRYYAGWTTKLEGRTIPVSIPGFTVYTVLEPMGVCGAITPWNYPMEAFTGKVGPALACGNTLVLKPAEETPLSALWLGRLAMEAGVPAGVLNVVPGQGDSAGAALSAHPLVAKIGFTGSTEVGRKIVHASAGNLKRLSLELGGKSPNVIFADADFDQAIRSASSAIFSHAGQNCIAGSRLYVEKAIYERAVERLIEVTRGIRLGSAHYRETQVGPLVSATQLERVRHYIKQACTEGARLTQGGSRPPGVPEGGYYLEPTVFTDVRDDMTIMREEIFGPVVAVLPFDNFDQLIAQANDSNYGLAASIWTRDLRRAHRFANEVEAGIVWINGHGLYDSAVPFGGSKHSGYGRDLGAASLKEYTQLKSVWVGIGDS
jgi:acyl-CoA reductase-like NAD-dependent aldehyde dehydrogenase